MKPLHVLVAGAGMYVTGRGTPGHGTVLPALVQAHADGLVAELRFATARAASHGELEERIAGLAALTGLAPPPHRAYAADAGADYRAAIAELPDPGAVLVVVPDDLHFEVAAAAIAAGKHVLVVKPLTPTVAEARELVAAAERAGVYAAVEFHKRFDLANLMLRDAVRGGELGRLLYAHVAYSQRKHVPEVAFASWVERTSIFQYLGVHYADILHFATGAVPTRVLALGQRGHLAGRGLDARDAIQAVVEWSTGFVSTFLTSWVDPEGSQAMSIQRIELVGTSGRIESDQTDRGVRTTTDAHGLETPNPYFSRVYGDPGSARYRGYGIDSVTAFLRDAAGVAAGTVAPAELEGSRPTFRSALASTAIVEGAAISLAAGGAWVALDDDLAPRLA